MEKYKDDGNHTCPALHRVAEVAGIAVAIDIAFATLDNPHAKCGVKNDRQEDESPLNNWQKRSKRMNLVDVVLKRSGTIYQ